MTAVTGTCPEAQTVDHLSRIRPLQEALAAAGLSGALLINSRDVYYYTGLAQPAALAVTGEDYTVFIRAGAEYARRTVELDPGRVVVERRLSNIAAQAFSGLGAKARIGLEMDIISAKEAEEIGRVVGGGLTDVSPIVLAQRAVKDDQEIALIEAAAKVIEAGHEAVSAAVVPGASELTVAAAVENAQRLAGNEGNIFMRQTDFFMSRGPVASGPNLNVHPGVVFTVSGVGLSPAAPIGPSRRVLEPGDLVVIDIPASVGGYYADQSRTYSVGRPPDEAQALFDRLRATFEKVIDALEPGLLTGEVYDLAWRAASDSGLGDSFLAFPGGKFAHFVGHGIGLEINEPPLLAKGGRETLTADMVLAVEMHARTDKLTVKLEDTVHLGRDGARILTGTPRELNPAGY